MASMQPGPNVASWPPSAKSKPPRRTPCAPNSASRTRAKLDFGATSNARRHGSRRHSGAAHHPTANTGMAVARHSGVRCRPGLHIMEEMQFLSVKPLSKKTTRASCADVVILNVMRHNARELQAEIGVGADCGIDASRIHLNVTLYGAATADGVAMAARDAMREHGIVAPRKNATLGIEIIVSLPADLDIDHQAYFRDAMAWAQQHYRVPLLSAILHNDESNPHLHLVLLPVRDGKLVGSELLGDRATMKTMQKDSHEQVGKRYGLRMPAPKKLHSAAERAAGLTLLRATLQTNSALTDRAIDALLVPHAKYPEPLLLALGLAMPAPPVKGSFVAMMTKKMRPEYPNRSFTKSAIGDFGPDIEGDLMGENKMSYPVLGHSVSSPDFPPFPEQPSATITPTTSQPSDEKHAASLPKAGAQWSAAQRSTSGITSATGQIRNTSSAQVQTVSLAQPLKPAVEIAPTSSVPTDQRQPADTLRSFAEAPAPATTGPTANTGNEPTKRARAAANRQPASTPAPGEHAEMDNLVLAQQLTSASTAPMATAKDVQPLDTPAADVDKVLRIEQVPAATALQSNASSNAPSMPRALPEARASPTALAHQLLAIASTTSTNERPKP